MGTCLGRVPDSGTAELWLAVLGSIAPAKRAACASAGLSDAGPVHFSATVLPQALQLIIRLGKL